MSEWQWGNTDECTCTPTPENQHYVYYGITEPGSAWEWDHDCPVHRPTQCNPDEWGGFEMETKMTDKPKFEWPCEKRKAHGPHKIVDKSGFGDHLRDCPGVKVHPATMIGGRLL